MTKKQAHTKHIPQRTCIACRQKFEKRRLTRIVSTADSGVIIDPTGKRNGRGAYVCDQPACWDRLLQKQGLLDQALKTSVTAEELTSMAAHKPAAV